MIIEQIRKEKLHILPRGVMRTREAGLGKHILEMTLQTQGIEFKGHIFSYDEDEFVSMLCRETDVPCPEIVMSECAVQTANMRRAVLIQLFTIDDFFGGEKLKTLGGEEGD